ncbi:branched-chain amino acid ABC transporter permease [Bordetella sp. BOR01]|uniref:branched-chain amino acid ABC transporter permease n=1 Tax=Bordetella sp. BOR01 TaxID=2854779 RepID=UPI001C47585C|nr:branched-chain amino acid ABC transporter permease [Bordetella sp. BOR01]MBV7484758.1 branched-chain amino acid ABC transporter permease [Bordetella sp. BOR01]
MKFLPIPILCVAALAVLPLMAGSYGMSFMIQTFIFIALAYSWNLIGGYAGYTHFGQVAFFGLGAYVGSLAILDGTHWLVASLYAGVAASLLAAVLGGVMLRLKGPYFAIGMFGIARVCESLALGLDDITQGGTGLYLVVVEQLHLYYAVSAIAVLMVLATWRLDNSRLGLQLLSIREDETAANALGVRTTRLKIGTFVASAFVPGVCGCLYACYLGYIDPATAFAPMTELTVIAMVLLGGMGTVFGPLVGAALMSVVNEVLWARLPEIYLALVGVIILIAVLYMPRGIVNYAQRRAWRWVPAARGHLRRMAQRKKEAT